MVLAGDSALAVKVVAGSFSLCGQIARDGVLGFAVTLAIN